MMDETGFGIPGMQQQEQFAPSPAQGPDSLEQMIKKFSMMKKLFGHEGQQPYGGGMPGGAGGSGFASGLGGGISSGFGLGSMLKGIK
jgi:hypothetical protein